MEYLQHKRIQRESKSGNNKNISRSFGWNIENIIDLATNHSCSGADCNAFNIHHRSNHIRSEKNSRTVQELIDLLKAYDGDTEVKICDSRVPVFAPTGIFDFSYDEDGAIVMIGE